MFPYYYNSLPEGSIRLLRLMPHPDEDALIQCQLLDFPLLESAKGTHPYEALSYVWGSPENSRPIRIEGYDLTVTANLHVALSRLRDRFVERLLWVDAICINQEDLEERKRQVQSMAKVYAKATRVVVWFGEATLDSDQALEQIRAAAEEQSTRSETSETALQAVLTLLQRPWFQRIWVLQEVAAARHILTMCGSTEIDGYTFCLGLSTLKLSYEAYPDSHSLVRSVIYLMRGAIFRSRSMTSRSARFSLDIRPLGDLIDMYYNRQATDRRDKVYALLGMSSDDPVAAGLSPDYEILWEDLFRKLIKFLLCGQVSVSVWSDREIAIIEGKGCILAAVTSVKSDITFQDRQEVVVESKNALEYWREGFWASRWTLHASVTPIQEGDLICLLQGASKPTIIRLCKDYFTVIAITATPTEDIRTKSTVVKWPELIQSITTFRRDFIFVWNWEESPGKSQDDGKDYASLMKSRGLKSRGLKSSETEIEDESKKTARLWSVALVLEDSENYKEAAEKLQLVVKDYERTFGQEHTNTLTAMDKLAVVCKKHEQAEAEKAERAAREAKMKEKLPIKFKDAVGRNFQFPFDIACTWAGIEELIKQAFLHVDVIGAHVMDGHYDLVVSDDIVLPWLWEKVVEPGMEVSMHMWPMPEAPSRGQGPSGGRQIGQRTREYGSGNLVPRRPPHPPPSHTHRRHRSPALLPPPLPPSNHHGSGEGSPESETLGAAEGQGFDRQKGLQAFPRMAKEKNALEGRGQQHWSTVRGRKVCLAVYVERRKIPGGVCGVKLRHIVEKSTRRRTGRHIRRVARPKRCKAAEKDICTER
ncbi:uncharacterized protein PAC_15536 [Phialocephala subalpina]|uniref:Uncharacterized protein n=1 Tax=Phialocephala subalpina TaxID=576137 RepID=A0A1L7XL30_9HELO|nr:uncharacterized protein PAC_15536 [Phialocephala subalpina]